MEVVKKLEGHIIYKKRSGRFAIKSSIGKWINGEEKTKLLLSEGLIKVSEPKKEEPLEEATEEASEEA